MYSFLFDYSSIFNQKFFQFFPSAVGANRVLHWYTSNFVIPTSEINGTFMFRVYFYSYKNTPNTLSIWNKGHSEHSGLCSVIRAVLFISVTVSPFTTEVAKTSQGIFFQKFSSHKNVVCNIW